MIAPAPSLSLCWQKPSPLFINLSSRCPSTVALRHTWARVFLPHLAFLHASQSVFGHYRTRFSSSPHPPSVWCQRTCVASLSGGFCASSERCQKGVSLARRRAIKRAHTHIEGHARGKCHRGGSHSAGKSFPLSFCLPSLPLYIIEKATQQGTLGGYASSSWKGGKVGLPRADEVKNSQGVPA